MIRPKRRKAPRPRAKQDHHYKLMRTNRWKRASVHVRMSRPICEVCNNALSVEAHHIVSVNQRPDLGMVAENMLAVCKACHEELHHGGGSATTGIPHKGGGLLSV